MAKGNNYIVYKHTFPNNKIYIGITCQKVNNKGKRKTAGKYIWKYYGDVYD